MPRTVRESLEEMERLGGDPAPPPGVTTEPQKKTVAASLAEMEQKGPLGTPGLWAQYLLEQGGPFVGGVAGAVAGAPVAPLLGSVGGAVLGGMLGAQLPNVTRPFLTRQPAQPLTETAPSVLGEGLMQGTGAMGGRLVPRGIEKGLAGLAGKFKISPEARAAWSTMTERGSQMTAGQVSQNRAVDILENIATGSIAGGARISTIKAGQEAALKEWTESLMEQYSTATGRKGLGELLTGLVKEKRSAGRAAARQLYQEVDELSRGIDVDTTEVAGFIRTGLKGKRRDVVHALHAALPEGWSTYLTKKVPGQAPSSILGPEGLPATAATPAAQLPQTTFALAQQARTRLYQISRKHPLAPEDEAVTRTAGHLARLLDTAMDDAGTRLAPDALAAFRRANSFVRETEQTLNNEVVRSVVKRLVKEPTQMRTVLMQPNNAGLVEAVKTAVPEAWPQVQSHLAQSLLAQSVDIKTAQLSGPKLLTAIRALGDDTSTAIFSPSVLRELKQLGETVTFLQTRHDAGGGVGRVAIQLMQGGALINLVFSPIEALAGTPGASALAALIGGPYLASRVLTNPTMLRFMVTGFKAGPGTQQWTRMLTHLATAKATPTQDAE